jgi:hypothetical protein
VAVARGKGAVEDIRTLALGRRRRKGEGGWKEGGKEAGERGKRK